MRALLSNPTFAVTTSAFEAEILLRQIDVQAPKSQAVSMSFSLDAVWIDGTIVGNNPVNYVDPWGLLMVLARVLAGNTELAGQQGGINGVTISLGSAAIIPSQFGAANGNQLASIASQISGIFPNGQSFSGISDVIGGTSPIAGMNVRDALQQLNPGALILEVPGSQDLGTVLVNINLPPGVTLAPGIKTFPDSTTTIGPAKNNGGCP